MNQYPAGHFFKCALDNPEDSDETNHRTCIAASGGSYYGCGLSLVGLVVCFGDKVQHYNICETGWTGIY